MHGTVIMENQFNHQSTQEKLRQKWEQEKTYALENNPGKPYTIDTPPPTVSGSLHIGHIFSYTQTDFIARYKRMNGFSVFYPFGFDDNGLPTERYVEKKRNVKAHQLGRSAFIAVCLEETKIAEEAFKNIWQQIGLSANWSHTYSTIADNVRSISQQSFIELYNKGYIYRKSEPALYCATCRTSVAQAELDDQTQSSFFNDILFKDEYGNNLLVGTTRPELLPSCVALLFNPLDERYVHLKDSRAQVPLFNFEVPIIADEKVIIEKGTGLVMCCTFGDKTDIEWYKKFGFSYKQSIGFDGKMTADTDFLKGLSVIEARKKIIQELNRHGLLIRQQEISHAVSVHERCKKEIEFVILKQWFINLLDHKDKFLALADTIKWYPAFMKSRYKDWVENLGWDWCISRQRLFGIPFPAWHCNTCFAVLLPSTELIPVDPQEAPTLLSSCPCGSQDILPDTDVMDTWNTSSLSPYICYKLLTGNDGLSLSSTKLSPFIPMSMRPQAHDIIRTWAFYTIVKTWMHHGIVPWQTIIISGHVLSESKDKLSKSKDNSFMSPETLLEKYPADAIRYWTASGSLGQDVAFSEAQLKIGIRLITKLWNAFKFSHTHLDQFTDIKEVPSFFDNLNGWMLHQTTACFNQYTIYFEKNEFSLALNQIEHHFWKNFCDNYLELVKDQLFNPTAYSAAQVATTKWTLYHTGLSILQMYAPFLPYITEDLYLTVYKEKEQIVSLHQTKFNSLQKTHIFEDESKVIETIIALVAQVRKLKTNAQLSLKTPCNQLIIYSNNQHDLDKIKEQERLIAGITHAQQIIYTQGDSQENSLIENNGQYKATVSLNGQHHE